MLRNLQYSAVEVLADPSTMFVGTETAARLSWTKPFLVRKSRGCTIYVDDETVGESEDLKLRVITCSRHDTRSRNARADQRLACRAWARGVFALGPGPTRLIPPAARRPPPAPRRPSPVARRPSPAAYCFNLSANNPTLSAYACAQL